MSGHSCGEGDLARVDSLASYFIAKHKPYHITSLNVPSSPAKTKRWVLKFIMATKLYQVFCGHVEESGNSSKASKWLVAVKDECQKLDDEILG